MVLPFANPWISQAKCTNCTMGSLIRTNDVHGFQLFKVETMVVFFHYKSVVYGVLFTLPNGGGYGDDHWT
jgi:hypothetical protein